MATAAVKAPAGSWALGFGLLVSVLFWIVAWHGNAALQMATTWWRSETFAHGLIIYPVTGWLIWRKRAELVTLPVRPCFWALLPLAGAAFVGLLGDVALVEAARQFGLVAMVALAVIVLMGSRIAGAIAFPLAFTLLAVPVGEFLLPMLMEHTADFTVAALRLTGIPVYREGLFFTVPTGRWSVVEACSGLRYLIASVTLGLLFAYLTYTTLWRRVLFVAAAIVVPIVANWLRAYMIVMIGHLSGMRLAVGVDHLIYGWVFFGVVMLLLFWVGSWWREDHQPAAPAAVTRTHARPTLAIAPMLGAALATVTIASAGPVYLDYLDAGANGSHVVLDRPSGAGGWKPRAGPAGFTPHFVNARSTVHQTFESRERQVGLFIAYYARQAEGRELIAYGNDLIKPGDRNWFRTSERIRSAQGADLKITESRVHSHDSRQLAWHWYWTSGHWIAHREEVKLRQAFDRLLDRGDDAAVVVVYTRIPDAIDNDPAAVLQEFVSAMAPSIRALLERARAERLRSLARSGW